jgi:RHS repeat-associated protein
MATDMDWFRSRTPCRSTYQGLGNDLPTSTVSSFAYDGDGTRVQETQAYLNLAAGVTPSGSAPLSQAEMLTNGDRWADDGMGNTRQYTYTNTGGELHSVQVDLGTAFPVDKVVVWHYAGDGRTYHATKTQVSANGTDWVTVFDSAVSGEYPETAAGHTIPFPSQSVRYVRDYLQGSTSNGGNHWVELEVWGRASVAYVGDFEWLGSAQTCVRTYRAGGQSIAVRHGNGGGTQGLTYLLTDHLGSTSLILDPVPNGYTGQPNVLSEQRYKAWGESRYSGGEIPTDRRFTGQRRDSYINLIQMGSRWYDSELGRFISPDPIIPEPNNPLAYDRYQYVYSNPVRYTDSSGHCIDGISTWVCLAVIGGAVLKAVDYGWTVYDTYQSGRVLANPNASREDKMFAGLNVGLAVILEAGEPDDILPAGVPLDDIGRRALVNGAKQALKEGGEESLEKFLRDNLGGYADDVIEKMGLGPKAIPNDLNHIFHNPNHGHHLDDLLEAFGGNEQATYNAVWREFSKVAGKYTADELKSGISVTVKGLNVTVRGVVVDGVAKIGTFFGR